MTTTVENQSAREPRRRHLCMVARGGCEGTGGLATYMRELGLGLRDAGWEVSAAVRFRAETPRGCEYHLWEAPGPAADAPFPTRIIAPGAGYVPVLKRLTSLLTRPALRPLALSLFRAAYGRALRAVIPESATHLHYVGTGWELLGFAALDEARRRGIPITCHPAVHPGTWGDGPLDIALYARLGAVLAQSEYEKRHLTDRGVSPEKIFVYGLGASSVPPTGDGAAFRARHGIGNRPVVLFIGRRQRYKGYHALAEAMAQVRESVPDALLVCVGPWGEPPYPELPEGALLDLGRVSEEEKEDALAACDVFCLPSTDESFGLVYVEAWRYGKPVIAGPAPAVREMVRDGENGYCLPQDPETIAGALTRLLRDEALCARMGAAGNALYQMLYTWPRVVEEYVRVVEAIRPDQSGELPTPPHVVAPANGAEASDLTGIAKS